MLIQITKADIAKSIPKSVVSCPIRTALEKLYIYDVTVGLAQVTAKFAHDQKPRYAILPDEAARFLQDFDSGKKVEPLAFQLKFEVVRE